MIQNERELFEAEKELSELRDMLLWKIKTRQFTYGTTEMTIQYLASEIKKQKEAIDQYRLSKEG